MKVFLDTNVVIDFLAHRDPFYSQAAQIMDLAVREEITIVVSSLTFVNAAYILRKIFDKDNLYRKLVQFAQLCEISIVDGDIVRTAIIKQSHDFEDCVQCFSAMATDVDLIVTRDKMGFCEMPMLSMTPNDFLARCV